MFQSRGGNSGFFKDGMVFGSDAASCLRRSVLRHHKIEEPINAKTRKVFEIGAINEEYWDTLLSNQGVKFVKEKEFAEYITPDTSFCGHSDFVVEDELGHIVYELKSVTSKNTYNKVFKKGEYKLTNLAQCVNYMVSQETNRGRLCYTSFIAAVEYKEIENYTMDEITEKINAAIAADQIETKVFEINVDDSGEVTVDGKKTDFNVLHTLEHRRKTAEALEQNRIFEGRPQSTEIGGNLCHFCPFSVVCNKLTLEIDSEDFIKQCKELMDVKILEIS